MLSNDTDEGTIVSTATVAAEQQQQQRQIMEQRGKELLAAHQQRRTLSAEDRSRLLMKGRAMLDARMEQRRHGQATAGHVDNSGSHPSGSGATVDGPQPGEEYVDYPMTSTNVDMEQQLDAALQQHDVDTELVHVLQGELSLLRKQLGVMREGQQLHTPLRSGGGAGDGVLPQGTASSGDDAAADAPRHGGGVPSRNVHDEWLVAQLQDQLAHLTHQANERDEALRTLRDRNEDLEKEALALCKAIADLQSQAKDRDDQLAASFDTIDRLESQVAALEEDLKVKKANSNDKEGSDDESARSRRNEFASPTSTVSGDQMARHLLEEQLHQLGREKLELERETEGQREIIANLQGQWNALVQEVQKRELILTEEVRSLEQQLAGVRGTSDGNGGKEVQAGYVPASQLEDLRTSLYAEFNSHVAQFQEVNNKHWAEMVGTHQEELKAKDVEVSEWREKYESAVAAAADAAAKDDTVDGAATLRSEIESLRDELERNRLEMDSAQRLLNEERSGNAVLISELEEAKALVRDREQEIGRMRAEHQQQLDLANEEIEEAQRRHSSIALEAPQAAAEASAVAASSDDRQEHQRRIAELEEALGRLHALGAERDAQHAAAVSAIQRDHEASESLLRRELAAEHEAALATAAEAQTQAFRDAHDALQAQHATQLEACKVSAEEAATAAEERFATALQTQQVNLAHAVQEQERLVQELERSETQLRDAEEDRLALSRRIAMASDDNDCATRSAAAANHQQRDVEALLHREQRARCDTEMHTADALTELLSTVHAMLVAAVVMPLARRIEAAQRQVMAASDERDALMQAHAQDLDRAAAQTKAMCQEEIAAAQSSHALAVQAAASEHAVALADCERQCVAQRNDAIAAIRAEMATMEANHGNDEEFYQSQLAEVELNLAAAEKTIATQQEELAVLRKGAADVALQAQSHQLANDAASSQSQLHAERIRRLEHELATAREAARPVQQELRNYRSVVEQLEETIAERSRAMGTLRQDVENKSIEIHDVRLEMEALAQELAAAKSDSVAASMRFHDALQERDEERKLALQRLEHVQTELDRAVEQHSKDLMEWQETLRRNDAAARDDLQAVKEELAVANTLLAHQNTGEQLSKTAQEHVRHLQNQLAEHARLVQQLTTKLQIAQEEIVEKSSIIRDQDFSLSSLGENSDAHLTVQHHAERIEELEARMKRLIREKDGALMEKDACAVELSNTNRKLDGKDQAMKRLESELRATKQQLQSQKSDASLKSRQLSDFRQEVAQYTNQVAVLHERVEEEVTRREEVEQLLGVAAHAHTLLEEKLLHAVAAMADEMVKPVTAAWTTAVEGFSASNANLLKRCDAIDALAQEALADGMRQNKELRNQCRAQQQRLKALEEAYAEGARRTAELEEASSAATETARATAEELHALRASTTAASHGLQRELVAARAAAAQAAAALERTEADLAAAESARADDKSAWDEAMTALRQSLKERHEQLQRLQQHSDAQMETVTAELYDKTRELHDLQRQVKVLTAQVADMLPRLEIAEPAVASLEAKAAELTKQLAVAAQRRESEGAAAQHRIEALEQALATTKETLETSQRESHQQQDTLATQAAQLHVAQEELSRVRERLRGCEAELSETHARWVQEQDARHQDARTTEQRLAALQKTNRTALAEHQDATEALQEANVALAAAELEVKSLKSDVHMLKADLADAQQTVKHSTHAAEQRVGRLEADLTTTATQLQAANALVAQLQDDKRQCLHQLSTTENLLREANTLNAATHRELQQLQEQSSAALTRADDETRQLQGDVATARKAAAASDARARDAERTCQSLVDEKQRYQEEFEKVRNALQADLHAALQEKQDKHSRTVDLHRQSVAQEAELEHLRREQVELQGQLQTLQGELAEYRSLVHSTSDRARLAVSEREELNGQVAALRDELRRQKTQSDRKIKELTEEVADKQTELTHVQQRVQQGAHVMRSSEMGLQQTVTDLTLAQHQLKHELAALTATNQALDAAVEQERTALRKAQSETAAVRLKLVEAEKALRATEQLGSDAGNQKDVTIQQLSQELEALRSHAAEDKRSALASLERVIQADRQALADVRQARERALRSADQAQRDRAELEQEVERLTAMVRVARRDAEECAQELQAMCSIADQAASEIGLMDSDRTIMGSPTSINASSHSSPMMTASHHRPSATTTTAGGDVGASTGSRGAGSSGGSGHHATRRTTAAAASNSNSFAALMDKLLLRVSASKRGSDAVAAERQQLRDVHTELDVHERAIVDASTALHNTQQALRQLSDRVEVQRRPPGSSTHQQQQHGRRSGSRSDEEAATSRDPSNERPIALGPQQLRHLHGGGGRPTSAASSVASNYSTGAPPPTTSNNAAVQQQLRVRRQRLVLSRLLQQCVLLEKCMQTASLTQESMLPHLQAVNEQLASIERAVATVTYVEHHNHHPATATGTASSSTSASSMQHMMVAQHSAIPGIEGYASVGKHVLDAAHHQRLVIGAGLCVVATRLAQQTRMLVSLHQQLSAWTVAAQQLPLDVLLQQAGDDDVATGGSGAQPVSHPLVTNPREFAHVFSQGESFAALSFLAIAAMSPVVIAADVPMPMPTTSPSGMGRGASSSGGGGAARSGGDYHLRHATASSSTARRRGANNMGAGDGEDEEVLLADEDTSSQTAAVDDGDALDSDDDANNDGGAGTRTRAFQKLRKENKRLYTLVRNLTEKLKVASVQASSSTTSAPGGGGGGAAPSGRSASAGALVGGVAAHAGQPPPPRYGGEHHPHRAHVDPTHDVSPIRRMGGDDDDDGCDTDDDDDRNRLHGSLSATVFPTPQQQQLQRGGLGRGASMLVPLDGGSPDADAPSPGDGRVRWIPAGATSTNEVPR